MSEQRAPYDIAPLTDDEFNQIFGSGKDAAPLTENDFAGILGDVPHLPEGWKYPERGERASSADRVAAMRYKIDNQRATLAQMQLQYDKMKSNAEKLARDLRERDLTLATLCDMVLGEDAADRSDDALVRAVGEMKRAYDARSVCAQVTTCNGAAILALEKRIAELEREREALRETIGQMEHEANTQHAAALDLQAQRDAAQQSRARLVELVRAKNIETDVMASDIRNIEAQLSAVVIANAKENDQLRAELETAQDNALRAANLGAEWKERAERYKAERDAALADARRLLELFRLQSVRSFVAGAAWWEFHETKATMWASDRDKAWEHAAARFPFVHVDHRENDDIVSEYTAMVEKYAK